MSEYILDCQYDSRSSFYSKARVRIEGNTKILVSHTTEVAEVCEGVAKVFGEYGVTTTRHIKEFLKQEGFKAESMKQMLKDYPK